MMFMESSNTIEEYNFDIRKHFNKENFFEYILTYSYKKKLLNKEDFEKIYYERIEILKNKLTYYTRNESSSVRIEALKSILKSIDYTIGIYLKTFNSIKLILNELKELSLKEMLLRGEAVIEKKISDSKILFHNIGKLNIENYTYDDTIDHGISEFFNEYEYKFTAHEAPGCIDYQLYFDDMNYTGIEYMYNYLINLSLENEFCNKFKIDEVNEVLKGYHEENKALLINVFELVLRNSLGVIICGRDLGSLNISELDREYIKSKLKKLALEELQNELVKTAEACCINLNIKNKNLLCYVRKAAFKFSSLLSINIKLNRLETVFVSFKSNDYHQIIYYTDGIKMSNSEFRKLNKKILGCTLVNEKIDLIKSGIKSLEDLTDMLGGDCLFKAEYIEYFKSLSQLEIIILLAYIKEVAAKKDYEKEWYVEFNIYISRLSKKEQKRLEELEKKIRFK
ncbi:hypothetical protein BJV85_000468 [Clostridium acetobutylicum]|uniref:Uncharacterized protein n=1 Tax=Clostridium acetobutylicum (strain ATCC 824 / DSM 792 / JCM 1419 / IAM 19013 / LMG 5710 / NBRC 13948 / NRRL B-527 / VKM B-1787 / 2291 / W) TaxID=272562 RepID=Q97DN8_CLOAB|nr:MULTISPECIES: DUF6179 domain-containing protein [Clostridium]AAK81364.1 Hypothetical protein CA_C3434 [Clostridium acetobutylicum ATCC 824]ADZ22475.1 hypothetical protein CEA_G3438 [Clostridium acetobutylicum EA 2018]AEI32843.1 hypothetical protein SMB_G3472 [Clostridium acetobutylicum DSM 1731]AWV80969.1 hypothetical protein DK921_12830 [Clostridium acetobutylicum]MBC2393708.1 hypothetical protein [Clostridium acetobutylicum]